jgi:hypothetical protein
LHRSWDEPDRGGIEVRGADRSDTVLARAREARRAC